jgi:hypothetical protein
MSAEFTPIKANSDYSSSRDFDTHYDQEAHGGVEALLLGHAVAKVADDHLLLDDGTLLKLVGNDGGCACSAGCYDLTALNGVENIITAVEFEDDPGGDGWNDDYAGAYRIFVFSGNERINLATFEGSDGNGYYGTGYHVMVRLPGVSS